MSFGENMMGLGGGFYGGALGLVGLTAGVAVLGLGLSATAAVAGQSINAIQQATNPQPASKKRRRA